MKCFWPFLVLVCHIVSCCYAHGYVRSLLVAGGEEYSGWLPFTDPYQDPVPARIVRKFLDDGPITDTSSPSLVCNEGGNQGTPKTAEVAAGSDVHFQWTKWPDDHLGPITTYMTSCLGDCANFDPTEALWFKIDEAGYIDKKWATTQLIDQNNTWTSRIPAQMRPGEYLLRNEIVALHDSSAAQIYPSCSQVTITGGGNAEPADDEKMTILEVYKDFKTPNIWVKSFTSFSIPGPNVAALARDDSSNSFVTGSSLSPSPSTINNTSTPPATPHTRRLRSCIHVPSRHHRHY